MVGGGGGRPEREDRGPSGLVLAFPMEEGGIWMPEKVKVKVAQTCHVQLMVTPWTIQFNEFSGPEYWSG